MLLKKIDNFANKFLSNFNFFAQFLLRLGLGIAFIIHGYSKLPLPPQKRCHLQRLGKKNMKI